MDMYVCIYIYTYLSLEVAKLKGKRFEDGHGGS